MSLLFGGQNLFSSLPRQLQNFAPDDLKNRMNSSFYSNHPGAIHPFLQIILMQFILSFKSSWCNSSFSSNHPGAIHPFLQIVLEQNSQRGMELNKFCPPNSGDDLCLSFCMHPSSMYLPLANEQSRRVMKMKVLSTKARTTRKQLKLFLSSTAHRENKNKNK